MTAQQSSTAAGVLAGVIRDGDAVSWGQGAAEPRALSRALLDLEPAPAGLDLFCGVPAGDTLSRATATRDWTITAIGPFGLSHALVEQGRLRLLPVRWSQVPALLADGRRRVDVLLLTVVPDADGGYSLGTAVDFLPDLIAHARDIVLQVNRSHPCTGGWHLQPDGPWRDRVRGRVQADIPPATLPRRDPADVDRAVAEHVARLVRDGDALEVGIGSLGSAVWHALAGKRDLGVHSGILADEVAELMDEGVITNRRKPVDTGITVGCLLLGGERLYTRAHRNPRIALQPIAHTHDITRMAAMPGFTAINFALSVDLSGQVNCETRDGRAAGASGGLVDFACGAQAAPGGRSIIALRARRAEGGSAIVGRLEDGVVTLPRTLVDYVVTEYGIAEISGADLAERRRRLAAIALPEARAALLGGEHGEQGR